MKRYRGITLIEILIIVAIVGIITAIIVPNVIDYRDNHNKVKVIKVYEGGKVVQEFRTKARVMQSQNGNSICYEWREDGKKFSVCGATTTLETITDTASATPNNSWPSK